MGKVRWYIAGPSRIVHFHIPIHVHPLIKTQWEKEGCPNESLSSAGHAFRPLSVPSTSPSFPST